jgi:hypothetical protein
MPETDRRNWLSQDGAGQRVVRWYFRKYAHPKGLTAHARDYLAVKSSLDRYFSMPKAERAAWLKHGGKDADAVLSYFKKYGDVHRMERAWATAAGSIGRVTDPELRRRLEFWATYFALTPDQRPAYIHAEAEKHGVFVWGALGDNDAHARELDYVRKAMAVKFTVDGKHHHLSEKQATYLYVKPLLEAFYGLSKDDRKLFVNANPELADYFARFATKSATGNKKLDKLVEAYFALPEDSLFRSQFLHAHPDVQAYFDNHSTPQELAMRNLLNVYFALPLHERTHFRNLHPEISVYFDLRRREKSLAQAQIEAIDRADPRLADYFATADADLPVSAEHMATILRDASIRRFLPKGVETRRDRRPSA